jgi:hypothetical protein
MGKQERGGVFDGRSLGWIYKFGISPLGRGDNYEFACAKSIRGYVCV